MARVVTAIKSLLMHLLNALSDIRNRPFAPADLAWIVVDVTHRRARRRRN